MHCDQCDSTFANKHCLKDHIVAVHTKQYPNYCEICNKGYTDKEYNRRFKLHIKKCKENKVKEKVCQECGKMFSTLSAFKRHIASHTKLKDFVCNICEKAYADKRNLKIHMERQHNTPECT